MSQALLRPATIQDVPHMLNIYGPFVSNTTVTAEYDIPTEQEFMNRLTEFTKNTPWIVCEVNGQVVGYAYASPHRVRAAYQWSVETSIYVSPEYHRKGIATALYSALFSLLHYQGYYNIYVGITCPNPKSISLHSSMGFKPSGTYYKSMFKFGQWHDVVWMGKTLREHEGEPCKTLIYSEIIDTNIFKDIMECSAKMIHLE